MEQIIVTTLIKSEHMRMQEQFSERALPMEYHHSVIADLLASLRTMFNMREPHPVSRCAPSSCTCCIPQQV